MEGWRDPSSRWLLLAEAGAVAVNVPDDLAALAPGTPVALIGRRGLRRTARRNGVDVDAVYLCLPDTRTPIAVAGRGAGLHWIANSVLTVPSGESRRHLARTIAVRAARRAPWLLGAVAERIVIGRRR